MRRYLESPITGECDLEIVMHEISGMCLFALHQIDGDDEDATGFIHPERDAFLSITRTEWTLNSGSGTESGGRWEGSWSLNECAEAVSKYQRVLDDAVRREKQRATERQDAMEDAAERLHARIFAYLAPELQTTDTDSAHEIVDAVMSMVAEDEWIELCRRSQAD